MRSALNLRKHSGMLATPCVTSPPVSAVENPEKMAKIEPLLATSNVSKSALEPAMIKQSERKILKITKR